MRAALLRNLAQRFESYAEVAQALDDAALNERLDLPKHRTVAEHLWRVVSSRETYGRSIEAGTRQDWRGAKLASSAAATTAIIGAVDEWTDERDDLLLELAEHELMHEAQIIRHFFGAGLDVPKSLRWAVCH